jgi:hypothetical protein
MAWMIGVDEAGYGPNLGPLVVAATVWHLEFASSPTTNAPPDDLYDALSPCVTRTPNDNRIAIADSKALYQPGKGLRHLERGVHAACCAVLFDMEPAKMAGLREWTPLIEFLRADPDGRRADLPWHDGFDCRLPVDTSADEITVGAERFRDGCRAVGVRVAHVRARLVFPAEFNELIEHFGTKGAALSHVTLALVRGLIDELDETGPVQCVLDKHGGRNNYHALLQHHFPDNSIETLVEGRAESRYRWTRTAMNTTPPSWRTNHIAPPSWREPSSRENIELCFRTKGEAFLPTALASMTAKYLRELAMRAENEFWCSRVANLRPTAGYPLDARRFKAEISAEQQRRGIADHLLWRNR